MKRLRLLGLLGLLGLACGGKPPELAVPPVPVQAPVPAPEAYTPAARKAVPTEGPLADRLKAFASVIEQHRWPLAIDYFDPEHVNTQREFFFAPGEEPHRDSSSKTDQAAFLEWYLKESMGLGMVDNNVDHLDDIVHIHYRALEEDSAANPLRVLLDFDTRQGPKTGWFFIDRQSGAFSAPVG